MPHGVIKMKILEDVSTRLINKLKFHKTIKLVKRKVKKSPTRNAYRIN
jgi:protein involved in temperature-dependent protein secretion